MTKLFQPRHPEVAEPQQDRFMHNLVCCPASGSSGSINAYPQGNPLSRACSVRKLTHNHDLSLDKGRGKKAFTLAEVLITLAIIGVVAAMTIPTLVANYQQKSWDTASSVFNRRLGEALKIMNANSSLAGYNSTEDFVNELGKHIKITKTCASDKLTDCFAETITTSADPIETKKLKQAKNLNSAIDYGTETIGVQFADGVSALIAYNPKTTQDPYSNQIVQLTQNEGKSVGLSTQALSILYDVSGNKTPNSFGTNKDIRGINVAIKTGADVHVIGQSYSAIDCSIEASTSTDATIKSNYDTYCGPTPSGYSSDYWAGAKKACADIDMSLPAIGSYSGGYCSTDSAEDTLCGIYNNRDEYGITSGWFWSSSEASTIRADVVVFDNDRVGIDIKVNQGSVVCVGN